MQTLELEPTTTERILIFEHHQEIARIRAEIESRITLLNQIARHGLTPDEIKQIAVSKDGIDDHIFRKQLSSNRELKKQHAAGAKNLQDAYELPENLKSLRYCLLAWHSYQSPNGRHGDKFQYLTFADQWQVNEQALENYLVGVKYKVYLRDEDIEEYNFLLLVCKYLEEHGFESGQLVSSHKFFRDRIEPVGRNKFIPNYRYFQREPKNWS